jgi:hypothetical protein
MLLPGSYANGFAPRDGRPLYPELWRGCVGAWNPGLGVSGLTLRDQSGFKNNGTLTNGPTWAANQGRYALDFDGVDDYVDTGKAINSVNGLASFSMSFWGKRRAAGNIVAMAQNDAGSAAYNGITPYTDGNVYFLAVPYYVFLAHNDTQWHHYAMTLQGSTITGYIDGKKVVSGAGPATKNTDTTNALLLGKYHSTALSNGFQDDHFLYNRALSAQEIRTLASRRGIAYEMAPRRRSSAQVTTNRRRRIIIGGNR